MMNFPNNQMKNTNRAKDNIILKKILKTTTNGNNNNPMPERTATAKRKNRPIKKAFMFYFDPFINLLIF